jgi:hypothetical protein
MTRFDDRSSLFPGPASPLEVRCVIFGGGGRFFSGPVRSMARAWMRDPPRAAVSGRIERAPAIDAAYHRKSAALAVGPEIELVIPDASAVDLVSAKLAGRGEAAQAARPSPAPTPFAEGLACSCAKLGSKKRHIGSHG